MPEIIICYLTIVINHFRARWRVRFGMLSSSLLLECCSFSYDFCSCGVNRMFLMFGSGLGVSKEAAGTFVGSHSKSISGQLREERNENVLFCLA